MPASGGANDGENVSEKHRDTRDNLADALRGHREWVRENQIGSGEQDIDDDTADLSDATRESLEDLGYLEE